MKSLLFIKHIYPGLIVPASVIIPITIALIKKVYLNNPLKIIFFYLIFSGIMDVVEEIIGSHHINNLPLLHFYTIAEFLFIAIYFKKVFNDKRIGITIDIISYLFSILSILDFVFIQDIHKYNSYPRPVAAVIIILFCLYHIFRQSEKEPKKAWSLQPENWMTIGLMIYFCSSLFYFAFLNIIYERPTLKLYFILAYVHATLVLLMYLLFARGFWVYQHER